MADEAAFTHLAILCELNDREFKKKLALFPEELRYYVILASSIVGAENSKRVQETPQAVVADSAGFVERLLEVAGAGPDEAFRTVLETYLIETLKDELRFNCPNCRGFNACLGVENLTAIGELFRRRVQGDETEELKAEIKALINEALKKTPHLNTDEAPLKCRDFVHHYSSRSVAELFGRYADIGAALRREYGLDYAALQQRIIALNMEFHKKSSRHTH